MDEGDVQYQRLQTEFDEGFSWLDDSQGDRLESYHPPNLWNFDSGAYREELLIPVAPLHAPGGEINSTQASAPSEWGNQPRPIFGMQSDVAQVDSLSFGSGGWHQAIWSPIPPPVSATQNIDARIPLAINGCDPPSQTYFPAQVEFGLANYGGLASAVYQHSPMSTMTRVAATQLCSATIHSQFASTLGVYPIEKVAKPGDSLATEQVYGADRLASSKKAKRSSRSNKPRLPCPHSGCKLTFPRKYELERHEQNFHERVFISCIVYGCDRIGKPVARVDKFREHMRKKHVGAHTFVCAVEGCSAGPFDRAQLCQHLNADHDLESCHKELGVKERLRGISLRITMRDDGSSFCEENGNCPLAFLGCDFRVPRIEGQFGRSCHASHIQAHDIFERAKGHATLKDQGYDKDNLREGNATCPVCSDVVKVQIDWDYSFFAHLLEHSTEERSPHVVEIWNCACALGYDRYWYPFPTLRKEYEATLASTQL